jgi:uncharacterized protein (TIGR03083 family)
MLADVQTSQLLPALRAAGERMAEAAEEAGLSASVPSCPGWTVRDLLFHTGSVHRWAASIVGKTGDKHQRVIGGDPLKDAEYRPADDKLLTWFREGHAELVRTLEAAPEDLDVWHFLPASTPLSFWVRRQTHETIVHRVDAEQAGGSITPIDPDVALDGLNELLIGFLPRRRHKLRSDEPKTMVVQTTDRPLAWRLSISTEPVVCEPVLDPGEADAFVRGPAERLYLALWNRAPLSSVETSGDEQLLRSWSASVQVTWN